MNVAAFAFKHLPMWLAEKVAPLFGCRVRCARCFARYGEGHNMALHHKWSTLSSVSDPIHVDCWVCDVGQRVAAEGLTIEEAADEIRRRRSGDPEGKGGQR